MFLLISCSPAVSPSAPPSLAAATNAAPTAPPPSSTPDLLPQVTLSPGEYFFSLDGQPGFLYSRNIAGYQQPHFEALLDWTQSGGSRFVRVQLNDFGMGYTAYGTIDGNWAAQWDQVFDKAEAQGLYVLPVFAVWFDWNAGPGYSTWASNPINQTKGGPARTPAELFQRDSAVQTMWLEWMRSLVERWQDRRNILGWEVFSEVNLATGVTQSSGIEFVNRAAEVVRSADNSGRPVTASLAETGTWPDFYRQTMIDFVNVHPYPPNAQLDRTVMSMVRASLDSYAKPVLIGESGLSAATPDSADGKLTLAPSARVGLQHAIWAGLVSGAMNGRSFWWEDGYGIFFPELALPWLQEYEALELPAARFAEGIDFSGFRPLTGTSTRGVWGAALGNERLIIGWYRDAASEPPDWPTQAVMSDQTVTLTVPGSATAWQVDFYDTKTGTDVVASVTATPVDGKVTIPLPDFSDNIAFKMYPQEK